ncbi:MAG: GDSL-type esterase/lipase family protein, partial [Bdellovibrionota bacterium]
MLRPISVLILALVFLVFIDSSRAASPKTIVFIGDSITDGYGVTKEEAYPTKVGELLKSKGHDVKVINGGTSGSVTAEADRRVRWFLRAKPEVVVLALGGNDGLKGTPVSVIEQNL